VFIVTSKKVLFVSYRFSRNAEAANSRNGNVDVSREGGDMVEIYQVPINRI